MLIQILGWLGNVGFVFGAFWIARKHLNGFTAQIFANGLYAWQALLMDNTPLLCLSIFLIGINGYGIYNWVKKESK
jgi:hypothetical protein